MTDTEYGLPNVRDSDGNLQAVEHSYDWNGEEVTIKLEPPTLDQFEEYEQLERQEDVDVDDLEAVVRRHLVEPAIPEEESLTFVEAACYMQGIMGHAAGNAGVNEQVREELAQHQGGPGN